jgi:hypothetical protein
MLFDPKVILSLCDYSGRWPMFYKPEEGYEVITFDLKKAGDIRWQEFIGRKIWGILCAPPARRLPEVALSIGRQKIQTEERWKVSPSWMRV